jgi:hypothetical protein
VARSEWVAGSRAEHSPTLAAIASTRGRVLPSPSSPWSPARAAGRRPQHPQRKWALVGRRDRLQAPLAPALVGHWLRPGSGGLGGVLSEAGMWFGGTTDALRASPVVDGWHSVPFWTYARTTPHERMIHSPLTACSVPSHRRFRPPLRTVCDMMNRDGHSAQRTCKCVKGRREQW